jgi:hypothetical protein
MATSIKIHQGEEATLRLAGKVSIISGAPVRTGANRCHNHTRHRPYLGIRAQEHQGKCLTKRIPVAFSDACGPRRPVVVLPRDVHRVARRHLAGAGKNATCGSALSRAASVSSFAGRERSGLRPGWRRYGEAAHEALVILWECSDRVCGKRLKPLLPILLEAMKRNGHLRLTKTVRSQVLSISQATIDRANRRFDRRAIHKAGRTAAPGTRPASGFEQRHICSGGGAQTIAEVVCV